MSKIQFSHILPLLTGTSSASGIQALLRDILVLQARLEDFHSQDFYFQKGRESHQRRLVKMKVEYAQIVETVNSNDVDFFLERIREAELKMQKYCTPERNLPLFAKAIVKASSTSQIKQLQELIYIKGKFGTLKPLDELIKDEATLIQIFEL